MLRVLPKVVVCLALAACAERSAEQPDVATDLGPLAVLDAEGGGFGETLGGRGPITIDEDCVSVTVSNGHELLLVWQSGSVSWSGSPQAITFSPRAGSPVTVHSSDVVTVGGETLVPEDSPTEREFTWIKEPEAGCTGEQFLVSTISQ